MAADPLDVLTQDEAKAAINHPTITGDALGELEQMVTAISRTIDDLCGAVVRRTVTERHDGLGGPLLLRGPVASITTVSEWSGPTETPLIAGQWHLDADDRLWRIDNGYETEWLAGRRSVAVTYVAGRAATTEDVDRKFKAAAASALRVMWQQEAPRWAQRPDFPVDVEDLPGFVSIDELIRRRLPRDLLAPTVL